MTSHFQPARPDGILEYDRHPRSITRPAPHCDKLLP
jgi:hypothetical protein